jgi:hypothetical protein
MHGKIRFANKILVGMPEERNNLEEISSTI